LPHFEGHIYEWDKSTGEPNYKEPRFWKRGAETLGTALRIASYVPVNAPIAPLMRKAATALDAAAAAAPSVETMTINPQDSPIAPIVPQQVLDIIESQIADPPKRKRKTSKQDKKFSKALKAAKKKHPRLARSKSNSARSQLWKVAHKMAKKMK
jgi:hypothetical protein